LRIGILSLQGGVEEHIKAIIACGAETIEIKGAEQLKGIDALILPGGESTTMRLLSKPRGLLNELRRAVKSGMPVFGTCAGTILLAKNAGKGKGLVGAMDICVERNAYGRQVDSFEAALGIKGFGKKFPGVFIRAPEIRSVGRGVEVLSKFDGKPVLVRQGNMLAATFHPELSDDLRIHRIFLERCAQGF